MVAKSGLISERVNAQNVQNVRTCDGEAGVVIGVERCDSDGGKLLFHLVSSLLENDKKIMNDLSLERDVNECVSRFPRE